MIQNNPNHALLCLKSWAEQGHKRLEGLKGIMPPHTNTANYLFALTEGFAVLLEKYKITVKEFGLAHIATRVLRRVILDVVRTYEPRMVEAGFLVPDPE